ncbi:hypothetical protein SAMN05443637_11437 [Pseudonocardia thermophila]|jgi:hypothetical protein|uniref:Uncharacterized protein n=1 Tax=Pseudonocardia thermophila TaxID=1848 RepID=A0A1M6W924_PSETH|nr:hypothetical protein [Pseudonocardia thermophila]SHK90264.1 hypothetical protein SAMN05443637_11437 [Pseudonocardia thermophila]
MISIDLVFASAAARLRTPMGSAWATERGLKQLLPSVIFADGVAVDHNSTGVSAAEHRWRP